jgi:FkbH-like protein
MSRLGLQFRLADCFGDNGMISVVILSTTDPTAWEIDTWLMSCRVLKRGVEHAVLNLIADLACKAGVRHLIGCYIPTSKNSMVADHYPSLGFTRIEREQPGSWWSLSVTATDRRVPPMDLDICL